MKIQSLLKLLEKEGKPSVYTEVTVYTANSKETMYMCDDLKSEDNTYAKSREEMEQTLMRTIAHMRSEKL